VVPTGKSAQLYNSLRRRNRLWSAWSVVHRNAITSKASATRREAREFERGLATNIERIARKLREGRLEFPPQAGILITKQGGRKRPIVVAPIESRIVQRVLLDALQEIPELHRTLTAGHNFGGVSGDQFGVPGAILAARAGMKNHPYFLRTDVKSFFERVPKARAIKTVLQYVDDAKFGDLFKRAVDTEIADAGRYGSDVQLFPLHDEGVAQGSCLSPLLCNLLLSDLDKKMNDRGIVSIRYIDDILLLGKSPSSLFKAFASAQLILADLGLECYDPRRPEDRGKAEHGEVSTSFDFLGYEISSSQIRPSAANRRELVARVRQLLRDSLESLAEPRSAFTNHTSYCETMVLISRTIQGWANTFGLSTDDRVLGSLDAEISRLLEEYGLRVRKRLRSMADIDRRRSLGVFAIEDRVQPLGNKLLRSLGTA
jgi:RNA-directed DNA polymerase